MAMTGRHTGFPRHAAAGVACVILLALPPAWSAGAASAPPPMTLTTTPPPVPVLLMPVLPAGACPVMPAPEMPKRALREGRSGWVVVRTRLKDGAVSGAWVVSEYGGPDFGAAAIGAVRRYDCSGVPAGREFTAQQSFEFRVGGGEPAPPRTEGFGLHAFEIGARERLGQVDAVDAKTCPIRAKLRLRRHLGEPNEILDSGNVTDTRLLEWLATLAPRTDYMIPNPAGNWIEFRCQLLQGQLIL